MDNLRVALYARQSAPKATLNGVDEQIQQLRDYAKAQDYEIIGDYSDTAASARAAVTPYDVDPALNFVDGMKLLAAAEMLRTMRIKPGDIEAIAFIDSPINAGLRKMLDAVANKQIDRVLVTRPDRLSRNYQEYAKIEAFLQANDADIEYLHE